jgi:teichoic acid transport system ATP-binding protein
MAMCDGGAVVHEDLHTVGSSALLVAEDVHVRYRVFEDSASTLRQTIVRGFRRKPHKEVHAVRGVSAVLHAGEALGVIGRNGSGKSTFLRAMAGLTPVASGSVRAASVPVLLGVGSVLQPDLSCRRNVVLGATALGLTRTTAQDRLDDVLEFAGLRDQADVPFRTLSSGMRARLQFAIATATRPEILMIDETLAVGDAEFRSRSEARIAQMIEGSGAVVLVSHSMGLMAATCTRMIWLDKGRVLAEGEPAEVVERYSAATMQSS